jgi:ankyrin repeat protein
MHAATSAVVGGDLEVLLVEDLTAFYTIHNKTKLGIVQQAARYYVNKRGELNEKLRGEYGADLTSLENKDAAIKSHAERVTKQRAVEEAEEIKRRALEEAEAIKKQAYEDAQAQAMLDFQRQSQQQEAQAIAEHAAMVTELSQKLRGFYAIHNRAKMKTVESVVGFYVHNTNKLNSELKKQYGADMKSLRPTTFEERLTLYYQKRNPAKLEVGIEAVLKYYEPRQAQLNAALHKEYGDDLSADWISHYVDPERWKPVERKEPLALHTWYETRNLEGGVFYYNTKTGDCLTDKPDDFDGVSGEEIPKALVTIIERAMQKGVFLDTEMVRKRDEAMRNMRKNATKRDAAKAQGAGIWVAEYDPNRDCYIFKNAVTGKMVIGSAPEGYVMEATEEEMSAVIKMQTIWRRKAAHGKVSFIMKQQTQGEKEAMKADVAKHMEEHKAKMKAQEEAEEKGVGRWVECYDPEQHAYYYYESNTHEMTWDKPEHYVMAADDELMAAAIKIQCCWRARKARQRQSQMKSKLFKAAGSKASAEAEKKLVEHRAKHAELEAKRDAMVEAGHGHWVECFDPAHEAYYYYESNTHEIVWDKPEHYVMAADDELMAAAIKIQCCWRARAARIKSEAIAHKALVLSGHQEHVNKQAEKKLIEAKKAHATAEYKRNQMAAEGHGLWVECYDPAQEAYYYYESNTHEMTWDKPEHYVMAADDELMAAAIKIQCCWRARQARIKTKKVLSGEVKLRSKEEQEAMERAKAAHAKATRDADDAAKRGHGLWVECYDPSNDAYYYYEQNTHEMTWDKPEFYVMAADDELFTAAIKIQCCWRTRQARRKFTKTLLGKKKKALDSTDQKQLDEAKRARQEAIDKAIAEHGEHWVECYDPNADAYYYHEQYSDEITWDKPEHYVMAADDELMTAALAIQNAWRVKQARRRVQAVKKYGPALLSSSLEGNLEKMKKLVEDGARLSTTNQHGDGVLRLAAGGGHVNILRYLLMQPKLANAETREAAGLDGYTALLSATRAGAEDCMDELLGASCDPNHADQRGTTPLMWAAKQGQASCADKLIAFGAAVNRANERGMTALHFACKFVQPLLVSLLLSEKADPKKLTLTGTFDSPLMLAAATGSIECVNALLHAGADVNFGSPGGVLPVHYAARHGHLDVCRVLKIAGAAVHAKSRSGVTSVDEADRGAARTGKKSSGANSGGAGMHAEVLELLLCTGVPTKPKKLVSSSAIHEKGASLQSSAEDETAGWTEADANMAGAKTMLTLSWHTPNGHGSAIRDFEIHWRIDRKMAANYMEDATLGEDLGGVDYYKKSTEGLEGHGTNNQLEAGADGEVPVDAGVSAGRALVLAEEESHKELPWQIEHSDTATCSIGDLAPGVLYQLRVRAKNIIGWGVWSDVVSKRTCLLPPVGPTITSVLATAYGAYADVHFELPVANGGAPCTFHQVCCYLGERKKDGSTAAARTVMGAGGKLLMIGPDGKPMKNSEFTDADYVELVINVCRAKNLAKADTLGLSDPYCTVYWTAPPAPGARPVGAVAAIDGPEVTEVEQPVAGQGEQCLGNTIVVKDSLNPVWPGDEEFKIPMPSFACTASPELLEGAQLRVVVRDKDIGGGAGDFLGQVVVDGNDILHFHNRKRMAQRYKHARHLNIKVRELTQDSLSC